ncbi:renin receptor-like [Hydractinia symbiolongicarpus]|uniref:renin receptor-like n=1 Tax=Hydractinia symbiolongicarpus TaxID=13093 RepID=UPI00255093CE|nr:renin receptor-like [Hydractinia symbiolongicarpus]
MAFLKVILATFCCFAVTSADLVGKFIFHGSDINQENVPTLSVLHQPDSIQFSPNPGPIPSNEVSSVLSLSLGLSIDKDLKWSGLQAGSLFDRPKAVMMFSVDSVPRSANLMMTKATFSIQMVDGDSSIADFYGLSATSSFPNHVSAIFDGKSTTVSVAADAKISAGGYSQGDASTTAYWSDMSSSWKVINGNGDTHETLSKHQILKRIPLVLPTGFTYNAEENVVPVNTKELQFNFNLESKADFNFFSELVYILWQAEEIDANRKGVKDGSPDVYLFAVSSLKELELQYSSNSKQVKGALAILEKFIPKIVKNFVQLYGGNILVAGITVPSELSFIQEKKKDVNNVISSLQKHRQNFHDVENLMPELHAVDELEHKARVKLCESIQGSIANFGVSLRFKCASEPEVHKVSRRSLLAATDSKKKDLNLSSNYDDMFAVIFNIWFWLLVLLALSVYAVSLALWNMDPGRDSIIYRLTQQRIKSD